MRVLHVSTYDAHGGAGRAALRLLQGLQCQDQLSVRLMVKARTSDRNEVAVIPVKQHSWLAKRCFQLAGMLHGKRPPALPAGMSRPAADFLAADLPGAVQTFAPDLVHLHWLCNDFIAIEDLRRLGRPIVWTLHDSWPFTGGCHVPADCTAYRQLCGACPLLGSQRKNDESRRQFLAKRAAYAGLDLTLIAPSRWMADCARASGLFRNRRIEVIANGLDTRVFRPFDKGAARRALGLPQSGERILLFGGMSSTEDSNKGFDLLLAALAGLVPSTAGGKPLHLVVFGSREAPGVERLGLSVTCLGHLQDDLSLVMAYSAAELMLVPSKQESFGQTAAEALACGLPVAGFATSGLNDVVDHQVNGFLARPFDLAELRAGIGWALDPVRYDKLAAAARSKAETTFAAPVVAGKHAMLYRDLLGKPGGSPTQGTW